IAAGVVGIAAFVWWQSRVRTEPLVPLRLFRDRNFSLGNFAVSSIGFVTAGTMVPLMFYLQVVKELSPTSSGLMLLPMAMIAGILAPVVGRLADRIDPRWFTAVGYFSFSASLLWLALIMHSDTTVPALFGPIALLGGGNGDVWAPTVSTAMRRLALEVAGGGSGVYDATRQVGAVLGSAAIGALMQARIGATGDIGLGVADAMFLPAAVVLLGGLATMPFRTGAHPVSAPRSPFHAPHTAGEPRGAPRAHRCPHRGRRLPGPQRGHPGPGPDGTRRVRLARPRLPGRVGRTGPRPCGATVRRRGDRPHPAQGRDG